MKSARVRLDGLAYELASNVVSSTELEKRVAPVHEKLRFPLGQAEVLTGIRERRWRGPGFLPSDGAARAGKTELAQAGVLVKNLPAKLEDEAPASSGGKPCSKAERRARALLFGLSGAERGAS